MAAPCPSCAELSKNDPVQRIGDAALFVESYVTPFVYLWYAGVHARALYRLRFDIWEDFLGMSDGVHSYAEVDSLLAFNARLSMIVFNVLVASFLLLRPKVPQRFTDPSDIAVPTLSMVLKLLMNVFAYLVTGGTQLTPAPLFPYLTGMGLTLCIAGIAFAIASLLNLRCSFSIFVEARSPVTHGMYRLGRHPIYMGHSVRILGTCLMNTRLPFLLCSCLATALLVYRALLEERKMAACDAAYAGYLEKTPSLFLRVFGLERHTLDRLRMARSCSTGPAA